ncbi:MAG: radical SAM protein [Chitinivibrionales bacterium]|nr:radical SAM protein [Chitinivibrionales bacterium]
MGYKIVLTCDRTMASDYHGLMFLGFSACLPKGTLPDWLYYPLLCPSGASDKHGRLLHANYGMRKVEAALLGAGFSRDDIVVAHPSHLDKVIDNDTKILSISSNDPLGIGPATSTFTELWGGEGRMAIKLRELLGHARIRRHKPFVFLGGPGAWQLAVHPERRKQLGVDCVVVGEGEVTAPKLFRQVLEGNREGVDEVVEGEFAPDDAIKDIVGGTTIGIVEATRGCARSCAFCVPTVRKVRSRPLPNILNEVDVNMRDGNTGVILHGEDILLYRSDGLRVNGDAVVELFERVYNAPGVKWVGASHASLSSAASSPKTIERLSRVLELGTPGNPTNYFQVGIETGSSKLIGRHMKGKVYPYKPAEWPKVVKDGFRVLHENRFVCCSTIIMGLPGEETEDIVQTTELIRALKPFKSIVVPLLFTPMQTTRLEYATALYKNDLTTEHHELITACWDHNLDWFPSIWADYGRDNPFVFRLIGNMALRFGTPLVRGRMHRAARRHGVVLEHRRELAQPA